LFSWVGELHCKIRFKDIECDKLSHSIEIIEKASMSIIVIVGKGTKYSVFRSMFNFLQGDLIMKHILTTFVIGVFTLFLSAQANAEARTHTTLAMEHAGMAQAHGEDGHAKVLLQHAKVALSHAKKAEKAHADAHNADAHKHMTEGVSHLKEAIAHAKMGHADVATKHMKEAIVHIRQSSQP